MNSELVKNILTLFRKNPRAAITGGILAFAFLFPVRNATETPGFFGKITPEKPFTAEGEYLPGIQATFGAVMDQYKDSCGVMIVEPESNKVIYALNEYYVQKTPASTIKLFIADAALEYAVSQHKNLNEIMIPAAAPIPTAGTTLEEGKKYSLEYLLSEMLIISNNQASNSVYNFIGSENIIAYGKNHGFNGTLLETPFVADISEAQGKELDTTAHDAAALMDSLVAKREAGYPGADYLFELLGKSDNLVLGHNFQGIEIDGKFGAVGGGLHNEILTFRSPSTGQEAVASFYCDSNSASAITDAGTLLVEHFFNNE